MARRFLGCRIEQIASWHPRFFLQPRIVACVAVMRRYSGPPAAFRVECINIRRVVWLGNLAVTGGGERADFRSFSESCVLEMSGTESRSELGRRHSGKVAQVLANPF